VFLLVLLAVLSCGGAWYSPQNPLRICRETFRYSGLLDDWRTSESAASVAHFPSTIPDGVVEVRVMAHPGFLQARPMLSVAYRTSPAQAELLIANFRERATLRYVAGMWQEADGTDIRTGQPPTTVDRHYPDVESVEGIVLGWNRGGRRPGSGLPEWERSYGLAVDHVTGDVWYWTER